MRGKIIASAAVFACLMVGAAGGPAQAYEFTGTFPGGDCRKMAAATNPAKLWYGHFTGRRQAPWNYDFIEGRTVDGCFRSKAECDNWLYQWRSAWQFNFWNDYCVQGWPPGPRPAGPRTQVPFGQ